MIGKEPDSMYFPDYNNLEIKTTTRYSNFPFKLFCLSFDGPCLYETNRILQKYGKYDDVFTDKKVLIGNLNAQYPLKLTKYDFKIDVDYNEKKVYLCVYDNFKLIERNSYVEFDTILNRIKLKLSNLVVVYASKKNKNNNYYFRYYAYKKYRLKDNINVFDLISENILKIQLMCRIGKSGLNKGVQKNKSLVFQINKCDIEKMFECVDYYDFDKLRNNFNIYYY